MLEKVKEYLRNTPRTVLQKEWQEVIQLELEGPNVFDYYHQIVTVGDTPCVEILYEGNDQNNKNKAPIYRGFLIYTNIAIWIRLSRQPSLLKPLISINSVIRKLKVFKTPIQLN